MADGLLAETCLSQIFNGDARAEREGFAKPIRVRLASGICTAFMEAVKEPAFVSLSYGQSENGRGKRFAGGDLYAILMSPLPIPNRDLILKQATFPPYKTGVKPLSDVIFLGLGLFGFVALAVYARALGRL